MSMGLTLALYQKLLSQYEADPSNPVYRLGLLCATKGVSVAQAAEMVGVTRVALYAYFSGDYKPKKRTEERISKVVSRLEKSRRGR